MASPAVVTSVGWWRGKSAMDKLPNKTRWPCQTGQNTIGRHQRHKCRYRCVHEVKKRIRMEGMSSDTLYMFAASCRGNSAPSSVTGELSATLVYSAFWNASISIWLECKILHAPRHSILDLFDDALAVKCVQNAVTFLLNKQSWIIFYMWLLWQTWSQDADVSKCSSAWGVSLVSGNIPRVWVCGKKSLILLSVNENVGFLQVEGGVIKGHWKTS